MKKAGTDKGTPRPFEEVLRHKLEQVEGTPKTHLWNRLEESLDQEPGRKKPLGLFHYTGLLVSLLLLVGSVLFYRHQLATSSKAPAVAAASEKPAAAEQPAAGRATERGFKGSPAAAPSPAPATETAITDPATATAAAAPETPHRQETAVGRAAATGSRNSSRQRQKPAFSASPAYAAETAPPQPDRTSRSHSVRHPHYAYPGPENIGTSGSSTSTAAPAGVAAAGATTTGGQGTISALPPAASLAPPDTSGTAKTAADASPAPSDSAARAPAAALTGAVPADTAVAPASKKQPYSRKLAITFGAGPASFRQNIRLSEEPGTIKQDILSLLGKDDLYPAAARDFDNNTSPSLSFAAAVAISGELRKGIRLETGLTYQYLSAATTSHYMVADTVATSSGTLYQNWRPVLVGALSAAEITSSSRVVATGAHQTRYTYHYLLVPLRVQLYADMRRVRYSAAAGFATSRLIKNSITTDNLAAQSEAGNSRHTRYFRPWLWSGVVSAGVGYQLTERLQAQVSGEMCFFFTPIISTDKIQEVRQRAPKSGSLLLGISYFLQGR